jgi:4'-phosphopantetheinyl transferase
MILEETEIHTWLSFPSQITDESLLRRYRRILTREEKARVERFRYSHLRHDALITRALVRTALSSYRNVAPESWRFKTGSHGKPELTENPGLVFNISHCKGVIACSIAQAGELGVDVETTRRSADVLTIAKDYFSSEEVSSLLELTPTARRLERFFELWTLKESFIKACGLGLSLPLDQFAFLLDNEAVGTIQTPELVLYSGVGVKDLAWRSWLCTLTDWHKLSITMGRETPQHYRLRFFRSIPLQSQCEIQLPVTVDESAALTGNGAFQC